MTRERRRAPRRAGAAVLALAAACSAPAPELPDDPPALTEWHREPVVSRAASRHVVVLNHADPSLAVERLAEIGERQWAFHRDYVGAGPERVFVHVGARYPSGFTIAGGPCPEVFLRAPGVFDTQNDWAHEMTHAFNAHFGHMPHWFNESLADVLYADSEIELYARRAEEPFLASFDRVDHRSYELMQLRRRYGRDYFRRVYRRLRERLDEARAVLRDSTPLEDRNRFLLDVLSDCAGEDLAPHFEKELGFNPKTRERQRGY